MTGQIGSRLFNTIVVDSDLEFARRLARSSEVNRWDVEIFAGAEEALDRVTEGQFELVSLEAGNTAAQTAELVTRFREATPGTPVVVFNFDESTAGRVAAVRAGAMLCITGRPEPDELARLWHATYLRAHKADGPVVIIDREASFRERMRSHLTESGLEVVCLPNAASLFAKLGEISPAALLLGRNLPGTGPLPLLRAARSSEHWSDLPVLIFVGRKDDPFKLEAYRAGADGVLDRDAPPKMVLAHLEGLLDRSGLRCTDGAGPAGASNGRVVVSGGERENGDEIEPSGSIPDVILIQDDPFFLEMLEYAFTHLGVQVQSFADGWKAVEHMREMRPNGRRPVVILEVDLPGLDGVSLLRERGRRGSNDFQFIVLSVDGSEEAQILALQSGAVDYLVKPIRLPIVLTKVQVLLESSADR